MIHSTDTIATYGNIRATTVPTPASFWYFCANPTIRAKYAFNGVMALTGESPTRYAASTASGATFNFISSGTKIGAKIAHFGIAPVMTRSRIITTTTKPRSNRRAWIDYLAIIAAIVAMAGLTYWTLRLASSGMRFLGPVGIDALTKMMGFLTMCIGVQFIVNGVLDPELLGRLRAGLAAR